MKKILFLVLLLLSFVSFSKAQSFDRKAIIDSLTTIDPEIRKYFPRWRVCETDLQIQIYRAFQLLGYNEKLLNMSEIEILSAPNPYPESNPYELLLISCGKVSMNSSEMDANLGVNLINMLNGSYAFASYKKGKNDFKRDYCYQDIPPEIPVTETQAATIVSYLYPTNVDHAFTLSLFDQALKIGETGFWLKNMIGTDDIGYPFWSAGESKVVLKRPLYVNYDPATSKGIPFLIDAYLGGAYRITGGIDNKGTILNWVSSRVLNQGPGGKLVAGLDFYMPFYPLVGVHINTEIVLREMQDEIIKPGDYGFTPVRDDVLWEGEEKGRLDGIVPLLRSTGQATVFYNWWIDKHKPNPEHYIRFDVGISYSEVREVGLYNDKFLTPYGLTGLNTYKPNEFGDWVFLKAEYRSQSTWPFGFSMQYSNQILLSRIYIPLFGNWLYLEGKHSTPLRGLRPYETKNFFMISPVLRLTI
ncbi:MAG: hypothetical protein N2319_03055 [Candidatus Kapabacteria bacterium]|nr:hypothetical protein [Candidatus Kapabacteria bacterium]